MRSTSPTPAASWAGNEKRRDLEPHVRLDSDEEIDRLTTWVAERLGADVPLHFTAFHPDHRMRDAPPTPPSTLTRARQIALGNGIRYAYIGNAHDSEGGSTYCPARGELLIERNWYHLGAYRVTGDGRCTGCDTSVAGVFADPPGTSGPRRLPVRLAAPSL